MAEARARGCWFTPALELAAAGLSRLPQALLLGLGAVMSLLLAPLFGRRRHYARVNLALCFPGLDPRARARLLRANLRATVTGALELVRAWYAPAWALQGLGQARGLEHLHAALASGRGVILLGGHFTHSELGARLLQQIAGVPVHVVVRRNNHPCLEAMFDRARRSAFAGTIGKKDVRGLLRVLARGGVVAYSADQNYTYQNAFVPFFGVAAATLTATPDLARRSRAVVLPTWAHRDPDGGYQLQIQPPWPGWPTGDEAADAARYMHDLERAVREHPEQYLWVHRRFKTRPPGEPDPYRRSAHA